MQKKYIRSDFPDLVPFSEEKAIAVPAIEKAFSTEELAKIELGHSADSMDEKWYIFQEDGVLHFFRSWTGKEFCRLKLDRNSIYDINVDNMFNPEKPMSEEYIKKAIVYVIDAVLLGKNVCL